jgi:hypothetical protein
MTWLTNRVRLPFGDADNEMIEVMAMESEVASAA